MAPKTGLLKTALWLCFTVNLLSLPSFFMPLRFASQGNAVSMLQSYMAAMAGIFVLGWAAVIAWAALKPIDRGGVSIITTLVMAGLIIIEIAGLAVSKSPPMIEQVVFGFLTVQIVLLLLLIGGMWQARIFSRDKKES